MQQPNLSRLRQWLELPKNTEHAPQLMEVLERLESEEIGFFTRDIYQYWPRFTAFYYQKKIREWREYLRALEEPIPRDAVVQPLVQQQAPGALDAHDARLDFPLWQVQTWMQAEQPKLDSLPSYAQVLARLKNRPELGGHRLQLCIEPPPRDQLQTNRVYLYLRDADLYALIIHASETEAPSAAPTMLSIEKLITDEALGTEMAPSIKLSIDLAIQKALSAPPETRAAAALELAKQRLSLEHQNCLVKVLKRFGVTPATPILEYLEFLEMKARPENGGSKDVKGVIRRTYHYLVTHEDTAAASTACNPSERKDAEIVKDSLAAKDAETAVEDRSWQAPPPARGVWQLLYDVLSEAATAYVGKRWYWNEGPYSCHGGLENRLLLGVMKTFMPDAPGERPEEIEDTPYRRYALHIFTDLGTEGKPNATLNALVLQALVGVDRPWGIQPQTKSIRTIVDAAGQTVDLYNQLKAENSVLRQCLGEFIRQKRDVAPSPVESLEEEGCSTASIDAEFKAVLAELVGIVALSGELRSKLYRKFLRKQDALHRSVGVLFETLPALQACVSTTGEMLFMEESKDAESAYFRPLVLELAILERLQAAWEAQREQDAVAQLIQALESFPVPHPDRIVAATLTEFLSRYATCLGWDIYAERPYVHWQIKDSRGSVIDLSSDAEAQQSEAELLQNLETVWQQQGLASASLHEALAAQLMKTSDIVNTLRAEFDGDKYHVPTRALITLPNSQALLEALLAIKRCRQELTAPVIADWWFHIHGARWQRSKILHLLESDEHAYSGLWRPRIIPDREALIAGQMLEALTYHRGIHADTMMQLLDTTQYKTCSPLTKQRLLWCAIRSYKSPSMVKKLLATGARANEPMSLENNNRTPLMDAILSNEIDLVKVFLTDLSDSSKMFERLQCQDASRDRPIDLAVDNYIEKTRDVGAFPWEKEKSRAILSFIYTSVLDFCPTLLLRQSRFFRFFWAMDFEDNGGCEPKKFSDIIWKIGNFLLYFCDRKRAFFLPQDDPDSEEIDKLLRSEVSLSRLIALLRFCEQREPGFFDKFMKECHWVKVYIKRAILQIVGGKTAVFLCNTKAGSIAFIQNFFKNTQLIKGESGQSLLLEALLDDPIVEINGFILQVMVAYQLKTGIDPFTVGARISDLCVEIILWRVQRNSDFIFSQTLIDSSAHFLLFKALQSADIPSIFFVALMQNAGKNPGNSLLEKLMLFAEKYPKVLRGPLPQPLSVGDTTALFHALRQWSRVWSESLIKKDSYEADRLGEKYYVWLSEIAKRTLQLYFQSCSLDQKQAVLIHLWDILETSIPYRGTRADTDVDAAEMLLKAFLELVCEQFPTELPRLAQGLLEKRAFNIDAQLMMDLDTDPGSWYSTSTFDSKLLFFTHERRKFLSHILGTYFKQSMLEMHLVYFCDREKLMDFSIALKRYRSGFFSPSTGLYIQGVNALILDIEEGKIRTLVTAFARIDAMFEQHLSSEDCSLRQIVTDYGHRGVEERGFDK